MLITIPVLRAERDFWAARGASSSNTEAPVSPLPAGRPEEDEVRSGHLGTEIFGYGASLPPGQLGREVRAEGCRVQPHGCHQLSGCEERLPDARGSTAEDSAQHSQQR